MHDCDFKFYCEEFVKLMKEKEIGLINEDEFGETLCELAEEMKIHLERTLE